MLKIVSVTDLQRKFRLFFEEVVYKGIPLILTRGSRPEAVLIPYDDFLRFQQMENEVVTQFNKVWNRLAELNAAYTVEEISSDIETARQE